MIFGAGSGLGGDSHAQLLLVNKRSLSRGFKLLSAAVGNWEQICPIKSERIPTAKDVGLWPKRFLTFKVISSVTRVLSFTIPGDCRSFLLLALLEKESQNIVTDFLMRPRIWTTRKRV